ETDITRSNNSITLLASVFAILQTFQPRSPWNRHHEASAPPISTPCSRRRRFPGPLANSEGASLSIAAGAHHRGRTRGRRDRHDRAPDWPVAVGATGPAICHREPAGRGRQYRRGGRYTLTPGWLHAVPCDSSERHQRDNV